MSKVTDLIEQFGDVIEAEKKSKRELDLIIAQKEQLIGDIKQLEIVKEKELADLEYKKQLILSSLELAKDNHKRIIESEQARIDRLNAESLERKKNVDELEAKYKVKKAELDALEEFLNEKQCSIEKREVELSDLDRKIKSDRENVEALIIKDANIQKNNDKTAIEIESARKDALHAQEIARKEQFNACEAIKNMKDTIEQLKRQESALESVRNDVEAKKHELTLAEQKYDVINAGFKKQRKDIEDAKRCLDAEKAEFALECAKIKRSK